MKIKETIQILLILTAGLILGPRAAGQSVGQASLVVDIEPMAYVEAPTTLLWSSGEGATTVELPVHAMLRLNRGATADLSISMTNPGEMSPIIEVKGAGGFLLVSESPVLLNRFSRSGVYDHPVVLRASPTSEIPDSVALRVRLSFSDGSAEWSAPVLLQK